MRPKKTILCVDDNEQILSVRTFLLETRGYRVTAVGSSHEALAYIQNAVPGSIDLLLCDLLMPQMDGNELVRRAKQYHPGLPAMIVSGTVTAYDRAGRADVFLPKGAGSPAEMLERIRVLVARKRGPKKAIAAAATGSAGDDRYCGLRVANTAEVLLLITILCDPLRRVRRVRRRARRGPGRGCRRRAARCPGS